LLALDGAGDRRVVDDDRVQCDGDLALGVVGVGVAGRLAGQLLEAAAAAAAEAELGLPLAGGDPALAGGGQLGAGGGAVGAAQGDVAQQQLGRVGAGPQLAGLLAGAQDDIVLVGVVGGGVGLGLGGG